MAVPEFSRKRSSTYLDASEAIHKRLSDGTNKWRGPEQESLQESYKSKKSRAGEIERFNQTRNAVSNAATIYPVARRTSTLTKATLYDLKYSF